MAGSAEFTADQSGMDITLNQLDVAGDITPVSSGAGADVTIVNTSAVDIGGWNVGGNLSVTAATGDITDSSAATVGGVANFTTSQANADIVLDELAVSGTIGLNTSGATANATIVNATGVTLVTSGVGGNLDVTATTGDITDSGSVLVGGTGSFTTSEEDADIALNQISITGAITPVTTGSGADVTIVNATAVDMTGWMVGGDLSVTATTGNITDSGTNVVNGDSSFTTSQSGADITLDQTTVTGAASFFTSGSGANVTLTHGGALTLGLSNIAGDLTVTTTTGGLTDTGTSTVGGDATFTTSQTGADIALNQLAVSGSVSVNTTGSTGDATIVNNAALDLAESSVGGTLTATAQSGNLTDSDTVTVGGNAHFTTSQSNADINLSELDAAGTITVHTAGSSGNATVVNADDVVVGASSVGGNLALTATTGTLTDGGTVTVGGDASFTATQPGADITLNQLAVTGAITPVSSGEGADVTIVNATGVDIGGWTVGGNLSVTAATGDITDSGSNTVGGSASFATSQGGADITLNQIAITGPAGFTTVGSGGNVTFTHATGVSLAASGVSGNLAVTATTGNITDAGTITVTGASSFTTSQSGADILVDQLASTGAVTLNTLGSGGNATVVNATALTLGASTVGGALTATATTGSLTDSGTVTVGGTATFTTTQASADIVVNQLAVASPGRISVNTNGSTGHATVVNATAVDLAASAVGGNLAVTATTGNLTDSGTVTVGGNAAFTTSQANADITVNQLAVAGTVSLTTSGATGNAVVVDTGTLALGASTVGGSLTATASGGNLTDSGAVSVGGAAGFVTGLSGADITLDSTAITGAASFTTTGAGADATFSSAAGVTLGTSNVGGSLTVTAALGNITDSGVVTIGGSGIFTTAQGGSDITLDQLAATGALRVSTVGGFGDATIVNAGAVNLGTSTVGGALSVRAVTGGLTDSGVVTVGGASTFTTSQANADIVVNQLAATGAISVNTVGSDGDATIVSDRTVVLGASVVGDDLSVTANKIAAGTTGNVTDSGVVRVIGDATFRTTGTNSDMTLDQLNVTGTLAANTAGTTGNATLVNAAAINFGAMTVGGNLTATASTGDITDAGLVTVAKTGRFTTTTSGRDILLDQVAVSGQTRLFTAGAAGNATVVNAGRINFGQSSVGGALTATATTGNIIDNGIVTVGGAGRFTTSQAARRIILNQLAVSGGIRVFTAGAAGHATIVNAGGVNLGQSLIGGDLSVTANTGNINDTGAVTGGGDGLFTVLGAGTQVLLDQTTVAGTIVISQP